MIETDCLVIGSGCAGLYCALHLPKEKEVIIITKSAAEESDSFLAQGGMCMLKEESDYSAFFEDTLKAGHYENDRTSVDVMIRSSQEVVKDLIFYGADFQKDESGKLLFTKEGAHSTKRIIYHEDTTGKEITSTLLKAVRKQRNIRIMEYTTMIDLIEKENRCYGAVIKKGDGTLEAVCADDIVIATGGIGGLYEHSTNYAHITGDAHAIALKHGIELKNMDYVQIHPTTFYTEAGRNFLISESVRGEGAVLRDKNGNRFVNELLPRDLLTKEIWKQMEKDGTEYVWEDLRTIPSKELMEHFPNIVAHCKEHGYDVTKECIPVVPAQHYFMGGIKVNHDSKTSMEYLYAIGEAACNGVHGKNRLASNSLLESLVFAKRAAKHIEKQYAVRKQKERAVIEVDLEQYANIEHLQESYKNAVRTEIEYAKKRG